MSNVRELGPPDRRAAGQAAAQPRRESVAAPLVIVSADSRSAARRRGSLFNIIDPGTSLTEARTDHRPSINGPPPPLVLQRAAGGDNPRRPSCVIQQDAVQVPGKQRKKSAAAFRPPIFSSVEVSIDDDKKIAPLAEEIEKRLSGTKDQPADALLLFGDSKSLPGGDANPAVTAFSIPAAVLSSSSGGNNRNRKLTTTSEYSVISTDSAHRHSNGTWRLRWSIDKVGRQAGQIRCVKDLCLLRGGNVVATESRNGRLQLFSKAGKSLTVLGPESESGRTVRSFGNHPSLRKMQPTGVTETGIDNLVAVTDLNRILYVGAAPDGELETEVILKGKTMLHGITTDQNSKLIISEVCGSTAIISGVNL